MTRPGTLPAGAGLVGRLGERRRIDAVVEAAAAGRGGALVLTGEAGIGRSALLARAAEAAPGLRVVRVSGSEFEQELPYAGLHQLCLSMMEHLPGLPPRHRDALRVAFGLAEGTPDPFPIGLAALGLLTAAAREQPLLCLVDDAQWLDAASLRALLFLARRLTTDPIAMLFAVRTHTGADALAELPGLVVRGLPDEDAKHLLTTRNPFPLDDQVRDRLVAEAHGNPLALLELPRAGGFLAPAASSVPTRVEHSFRDRLAGLTAGARLLLTVASADPTGDPDLLWAAAGDLGLDLARCSAEAAATGLADFGHRISFCHPLARSAVYRAAPAADRRRAHGALARCTDPVVAPDRRAWHRAQASAGPDDAVAAELVRCAARAQARGGPAAAAAFLARAVALSLDPEHRIDRTLAAARAAVEAGLPGSARELLATLDPAALDDVRRAHADLVRGRAACTLPNDDAGPALMTRAARRLSARRPAEARGWFLDTLEMSLVVGRGGGVIRGVLDAARSATPAPAAPDLLDALTGLVTHGYPAAVPLLRGALHGEAPRGDEPRGDNAQGDQSRGDESRGDDPPWVRWPALATMTAVELFDLETHTAIADRLVEDGRASGSPLLLQLGLAQQAVDAVVTGDIGRALAATAEEAAVADAAGIPSLVYHRLHLAAQRGRRAEFDELARAAAAAPPGAGRVTNLHATAATLHNGLADYPAALAAARRATGPEDVFLTGVVLPELIEAAVRCGDPAAATEALAALTERTEASGSTAGRGIAAYARGVVTGVEDHFAESVALLTECRLLPYRGRAHLLYGEWLRRQGRRRDGRRQLRLAHDLLTRAGNEAFARRAADELRATGLRVNAGAERPHERLTMQEVAVARLVAAGATSHEVAGRLFISKRTVDAHLRSIFRKLGVSSRRQLKDHPELVTGGTR